QYGDGGHLLGLHRRHRAFRGGKADIRPDWVRRGPRWLSRCDARELGRDDTWPRDAVGYLRCADGDHQRSRPCDSSPGGREGSRTRRRTRRQIEEAEHGDGWYAPCTWIEISARYCWADRLLRVGIERD